MESYCRACQVLPVQRHEDMTNVQLSTPLGQIEVSLQSVTVDSEIVAEAPAIALQIVTKAEYCDEFSATWPANTLDAPQTTLQIAVGHDCLSVLEPQPAALATPSIRSCCHRVRSPALWLQHAVTDRRRSFATSNARVIALS
jgi:hypothetical protein